MGYALAEAALRRGARVLLVSGPTALKPPAPPKLPRSNPPKRCVRPCSELLPKSTIVIKAAAVADYRPKIVGRCKRSSAPARRRSTSNPPPTSSPKSPATRPTRLIIGFAAETENVLENARKKLARKITRRHRSQRRLSQRRRLRLRPQRRNHHHAPTKSVEVPETTKWEVAQRILDLAAKLRHRTRVTPH